MKKEEITALLERFESIACEVEGVECWSARELQPLLGYVKWDVFINNVVVKAKEACSNAEENIDDHFPDVRKVIIQAKDLYGQSPIEREHVDNNSAVRDMLLKRDIRPEQLSPDEDVKKVKRRIDKDNLKTLKNK